METRKPLPKPSIIELSQWQKEWYSVLTPKQTKEEFFKQKHKEWYRYQWYLTQNK